MNYKERRRAPRSPSSVPLELYDPQGRVVVGEGRFVNLSEQGALVVSRKPLKKRETVRLHVISGRKSPLELRGKVVWTRKKTPGFAYGIRFDAHEPPRQWGA